MSELPLSLKRLQPMSIASLPTYIRHAVRWPARCSVLLVAAALGLSTLTTGPAHAQAAAVTGLPDFTELVERVGPAVVNIRTTERNRAGRGAPGAGPSMDEDMLEFFRRFGIPIPGTPGPQTPRRGGPQQPQPEQEARPRGVGSGFIISADGYVMTNAHVVEDAEDVFVTLTDKREFKARVVGADKRTDVALVKIDASALPVVRIGDVGRLKVGEWVMAIGSPFGLENTVTAGIVSAKARDTGDFLPFIQTDVAINPGNSGGPLINMRGEVVGINSQIYSRSGGFMGISFAIPIDEATRVSDSLRTDGRVIRGRIGVQIGPVSKEVAESIGLGKPSGAFVSGVESGGPADKGGVEAGDIITRVDGRVVEKSGDLPRIIGGIKPGQKTTLQVFRRGTTRDIVVSVVEFEPPPPARRAAAAPEKKPSATMSALGVAVTDLSDDQKKELKLKNGVRVESVEGAAARAGLREGDVLIAIDNTELTSAKQFETVVGKLDKTKPTTVLMRRGEWVNYLVIRPAPR